MRPTFLLMLAASLALHALLAGGAALCLSAGSSTDVPRPEQTLSLIMPKPLPVLASSVPHAVKRVVAPAVATSVSTVAPVVFVPPPPLALPPAAAPAVKQPAPPVMAKVETNPNAHLPAALPDSVLAPVPAPRLDGTKGVVFILDISGSMYESYAGATRLAFARQSLGERVRALPDGTPFAVVLYARVACASGPLVAANAATREAAVRFLMRDVNCDGGTNLPAGLAAARALNTGALVLATDGDLNISCSDLMIQAQEILGKPGTAPSLLVIGIAPRSGTTADHLLQDLANLEGGTYQVEVAPDETALR